MAIYTLSSLVEQSTPAMLEIVDAYATVTGSFFVDQVADFCGGDGIWDGEIHHDSWDIHRDYRDYNGD